MQKFENAFRCCKLLKVGKPNYQNSYSKKYTFWWVSKLYIIIENLNGACFKLKTNLKREPFSFGLR